MTNVEGFIGIIIIITLVMALVGCGVLVLAHAILSHLENRWLRAGVIVCGMAANWYLFCRADLSWLIIGSLLIAVPMAVLAPPLVSEREACLRRLLARFAFMTVLISLLPFALIVTEISMIPFIYWHTPLSNAVVYLFLMIMAVGVSWAIDRCMDRILPCPAST